MSGSAPEIDIYREAILREFPELENARFRLLTMGWDSVAVDVNDRWIFKFSRDEGGEKALIKEAALLRAIRAAISLPVPDLEIYAGSPCFSRHRKLKGDHLVTAQYERLPEMARQRLGAKLARFYAELHELDAETMMRAGAEPIEAWQAPSSIRAKALPILPPEIRGRAETTLRSFEDLQDDPYGTTYGFFDGHGWNMAFDHATAELTGMYDFGDSGFGPLHQEFIYSSFVSFELTDRIVTEYESLTGRRIDRRRVDILTGTHRLSELAELAHDPAHVDQLVQYVVDWARRERES